jgi:hypothetical protein
MRPTRSPTLPSTRIQGAACFDHRMEADKFQPSWSFRVNLSISLKVRNDFISVFSHTPKYTCVNK